MIQAVKYGDHSKLKPVLRDLEKVRMTKHLLLLTGIGYLVHDFQLWGKSNLLNIQRLDQRWRQISRAQSIQKMDSLHQVPQDVRPFQGMKSANYLATFACFEDWLSRVDVLKSDPVVYREAAVALVDEGLKTLPSLRGVRPGDAEYVRDSTAVEALHSQGPLEEGLPTSGYG